jgi:chloramphenicol O-acetyltransferase type A
MVMLVKTFDVSRLVKVSRRRDMKFTMLMCWCIGKAASSVEEFFLLPESLRVGEHGSEMNGRLFRCDRLAINVVVQNEKGGISLCDVSFSDDLGQFNTDYLELTGEAAESCKSTALEDYMIVGTSALPQTELDCIVNQYSGRYNNPFLAWANIAKAC